MELSFLFYISKNDNKFIFIYYNKMEFKFNCAEAFKGNDQGYAIIEKANIKDYNFNQIEEVIDTLGFLSSKVN